MHQRQSRKEENPRINGGFLWRAIHISPAFRIDPRIRWPLRATRFLQLSPNFPPPLLLCPLTWAFLSAGGRESPGTTERHGKAAGAIP